MVHLTERELLGVWEEGWDRSPVERALLLLARAWPSEGRSVLEALPVGRRDARLLQLRRSLFGPSVTAATTCPACGEHVEMDFSLSQLGAEEPHDAAEPNGGEPEATQVPDRFTVEEGGYEVTVRLPDSRDLATVLEETGPGREGEARVVLLHRCVLGARRAGRPVSRDRLPDEVLSSVARRMEQVDPHADLHASLTCPECGHGWRAPFDVVSFLWSEIEGRARRILLEVHTLASRYGWSEAEVLALSPTRRRLYMELTAP